MKKESIIKTKMKNGLRNRKTQILLCLVAVALALTGGIFYTPELKNADKPFIELSGSVGTAIGNAKDAYSDEHVRSDTLQETEENKPASTALEKEREQAPDRIIEIYVTDEEIKIGMKKVADFSEFETLIRSENYDGREFAIVDDFGEYKTIKRIDKLLEKLGKTYSIRQVDE